ncbi:MAG: 50S ribosomal protein L25 [Planctomycetota bacterium]
MELMSLKADIRTQRGTKESRQLRKLNIIPAVLYGGKDDNIMLMLSKKEAFKLLGHGTRLIELILPSKTERVVVKDLKYSAVDEAIIHVDFTRVAMDVLLTVSVEIILKGVPKGVKEGGVLEQNLRHLTIKCLPMAIPERIDVDVSHLELDGLLRVKDLSLSKDVNTTVSPEVVVAGVHMAKVEEVAPVLSETTAEPEVITQKKPTEESETKVEGKEKEPNPSHKEQKK